MYREAEYILNDAADAAVLRLVQSVAISFIL